MPGRSFILFYFVALASLAVLTQGSDARNGGRKVRNKRNKRTSDMALVNGATAAQPPVSSSLATNLASNNLASNNLVSRTNPPVSTAVSLGSINDFVIDYSQKSFSFVTHRLDHSFPSQSNFISRAKGPHQQIYEFLFDESTPVADILSAPDFSIPVYDRFALLPFVYLKQNRRLEDFRLFLDKFDYSKVDSVVLSNLLVECRNKREFFLAILESQHKLIVASFRSFWDLMLHIDASEIVRNENESSSNANFVILHQSAHWAFQHFATLTDDKGRPLTKFASFCIFNLLLDDCTNPFPETLLKGVLNLSGIELNVSLNGNCVALFTLGLSKLPEYYPRLILSDDRLNVNCIVPATLRKHGHITCQVPQLPLFWHALIYQNIRALKILWANKNLHVFPLIPSFFQLLRLTLLFLFFRLWDGKSFKGERKLA